MYDILERHLGHAVDRAALRRRRMQHEMQLLQFETVLPGVEPLLADGKTRGLSLAIASSSDRAWVEGHIDRLGLRPFFEAIVCAEDVQQTKPQPDLYLSAAQRLGVAPGEAIAFEDSLHGVRAAKTAGMFCVAVPNRITRCLSFDEADLVLDSLQGSSLAEILRAAEADEARNSDEE
jgi:HAD superfamily hydrolase (TIGR01509 family)